MNADELKMVQDVLLSLSANATTAFMWWLFAKYILGTVMWGIGGIVALTCVYKIINALMCMDQLRDGCGASWTDTNQTVVRKAIAAYHTTKGS